MTMRIFLRNYLIIDIYVVEAFFKWRVRISVSTPDFLRLDLIRKKPSLVLILVRMKKVQYLAREPFWQGRFDSATRYKCPSDERVDIRDLIT